MKLLLTSGGVTNPTIEAELVRLLGKPIAEAAALVIPTALWGHPMCGPQSVRLGIVGRPALAGLGFASVGVLELTALPTIPADRWQQWVRDADVLLVDGGDATYLSDRMRESGLLDLLPSLTDTVWVGVSAGSMVMTPRVGSAFIERASVTDDRTLGLVDFSIFPHLNYPGWEENTLAEAQKWALSLDGPAYALDDASAISVVDGVVTVVSEGQWELLQNGT
jgi:dipeptidase E